MMTILCIHTYVHVKVVVISITREACPDEASVTDDYCTDCTLWELEDISLTNNIRAPCEIVNADPCSSAIEARSRLNG